MLRTYHIHQLGGISAPKKAQYAFNTKPLGSHGSFQPPLLLALDPLDYDKGSTGSAKFLMFAKEDTYLYYGTM